jgi:hypothetical protein
MRRPRARHSHVSRSPSRIARRGANDEDGHKSLPAWAGPSRSSLGRALRLMAAAGTAAGGMCLVLAMVALVASMGAHGSGAPARPSGRVTGHPGQRDRSLNGRTLTTYWGTGAVNRRYFQVSQPGEWGISWNFRCPAGRLGTFVLAAGGNDPGQPDLVDAAGWAGHAIYWKADDLSDDSFVITATCPWTVRVVVPGPRAAHQGARSRHGRTSGQGHRHQAARHAPTATHPRRSTSRHQKQPGHGKKASPQANASHGHQGPAPGRDRNVSRRSADSSGSA